MQEKIKIQDEKFKINLKFYFFLKCLIKIKFNEKQVETILNLSQYSIEPIKQTETFIKSQSKTGKNQEQIFGQILAEILNENDLKLFHFSLKLLLIKDLLLELAKLRQRDINLLLQTIDPLWNMTNQQSKTLIQHALKVPYSLLQCLIT